MEPRERIVRAAADLLARGGRDAVSTRAVSAAAGVQGPTIYRLFGDKRGLLDAVATEGFAAYVGGKGVRRHLEDPVDDLRAAWDLHVTFGLDNPALFALMSEPRPEGPPPAAEAGIGHLEALVHRIAEAGRLAVPEAHAVQLVHAAGTGVVLTLIARPELAADPSHASLAREAVVAAITVEVAVTSGPGPGGAAIALRAVLPAAASLTDAERALLTQWLDRIAAPAVDQPTG